MFVSKRISDLHLAPDQEIVKILHSNRTAKSAPAFEMPKPHQIHHRALLWDTVYCDLSLTQSLPWLHLRALFNTLHAVAFDPRDPPTRRRLNVDASPDLKRIGARVQPKGITFVTNDLFNTLSDTAIGTAKKLPDPPSPKRDRMQIDALLDATNAVIPSRPTGILSTASISS